MNMSYCRFENTYNDLRDCYENLEDDCSESEQKYKEKLIKLCKQISAIYEEEEDEDDGE